MAAPSGSLIQTGLPQLPEGVPQELFASFLQVYQAIENLRFYLSQFAGVDDPSTDFWSQLGIDDTFFDGNLNRLIVKANEDITFGQAVSPINVAGVTQVRRANATTNARWCCGFSVTAGTVLAGSFLQVKTRGVIKGVVGMIPGSRYWLNTVDGQIVNAEPAAAGNIGQVVGFAFTSNRLLCNLDSYFVQH